MEWRYCGVSRNLIREGCELVMRELVSENGKEKVRLLEVVGRGQNCIAHKAALLTDGEEYQVPVDASWSREEVEQEMLRQRTKVLREVRSAQELYFDGKENSPYVYRTEFFGREGNSYYVKLDTSKGKTLKNIIREKGKVTLREAIEFCDKLLVIMKTLLDGKVKYFHCDIKPEDIWIRGEGAAASMILLDMGSVFKKEEYSFESLEDLSLEELFERADRIADNEGIGCSSEGYCCGKLRNFYNQKMAYQDAKEIASIIPILPNLEEKEKAAGALLKAINEIDLSVDLYSALQVLFYCSTGEEYLGNGVYTVEKIMGLTGEAEMVCDWLLHMLKKNTAPGYESIEELGQDLKTLKRLLEKGADPRVLLQGVKNNLPEIKGIDTRLFGKIE